MGVLMTSAFTSSPEWIASMMARVCFSFMRWPTPYLQIMQCKFVMLNSLCCCSKLDAKLTPLALGRH